MKTFGNLLVAFGLASLVFCVGMLPPDVMAGATPAPVGTCLTASCDAGGTGDCSGSNTCPNNGSVGTGCKSSSDDPTNCTNCVCKDINPGGTVDCECNIP